MDRSRAWTWSKDGAPEAARSRDAETQELLTCGHGGSPSRAQGKQCSTTTDSGDGNPRNCSTQNRLGAAGQTDIRRVLRDLGPFDAADRAELERTIVALDAHFVGGQGDFLCVFGK